MEVKYNHKSGTLGWSCPSNIAIIKYWGKRPVQLPMNPSISMTLNKARTHTRLSYEYHPGITSPEIKFRFEGSPAPQFEDRIVKFIGEISNHLPILRHTNLLIESENTFPHSSGIASSASAMGALAMCLVQLESEIMDGPAAAESLSRASYIARLGSGSASRSIFPGFALWGVSEAWKGSSDDYAVHVPAYHKKFEGMHDAILIVEAGQKKVSSSNGHALMESNPYAETRFSQARKNCTMLLAILKEGDWAGFIGLMEQEALTLHALMMASSPGYLLMQPGTMAIIQKVREFRKESGCNIGFTLDAGANVHLLYAAEEASIASDFINTHLVGHCENGLKIMDQMGKGPEKL